MNYLIIVYTIVWFHWCYFSCVVEILTLSWRKPLSHRNQSIDLDLFLYDNGLRHERVNSVFLYDLEISLMVYCANIIDRFLYHCVKVSVFGGFLVRTFPVFGLNTKICRVNLRIQSECYKIRSRNTPNADTFYSVYAENIGH